MLRKRRAVLAGTMPPEPDLPRGTMALQPGPVSRSSPAEQPFLVSSREKGNCKGAEEVRAFVCMRVRVLCAVSVHGVPVSTGRNKD